MIFFQSRKFPLTDWWNHSRSSHWTTWLYPLLFPLKQRPTIIERFSTRLKRERSIFGLDCIKWGNWTRAGHVWSRCRVLPDPVSRQSQNQTFNSENLTEIRRLTNDLLLHNGRLILRLFFGVRHGPLDGKLTVVKPDLLSLPYHEPFFVPTTHMGVCYQPTTQRSLVERQMTSLPPIRQSGNPRHMPRQENNSSRHFLPPL